MSNPEDHQYLDKFSDPKVVGPGVWFAIHTKAIKAKTEQAKQEFVEFMVLLCTNFPCLQCRGHCTEYLKMYPIQEYWNDKDINGVDVGMFKWSWVFHNSVNLRTGKGDLSWNTAYNMYVGDAGICTADCDAGKSVSSKPGKPGKAVVSKPTTNKPAAVRVSKPVVRPAVTTVSSNPVIVPQKKRGFHIVG